MAGAAECSGQRGRRLMRQSGWAQSLRGSDNKNLRLGRDRRHQCLQEFVRHVEAALKLLGEFALFRKQDSKTGLRSRCSSRRYSRIRPARRRILSSPRSRNPARGSATSARCSPAGFRAPNDVPENFRVLEMNVVNLVANSRAAWTGSMNCQTRCEGSNCKPTCGLS